MNNIFRILLLGALPLAAFPVIQASAQEPGYPDTTFSRTFLVHLRKSPGYSVQETGNRKP